MDLGVTCECGRIVPVSESDAGGSVFCSCTKRVVVPLLEEFEKRPVLPSASTIERRVMRLLAEGEQPTTHACQVCGESGRQRVVVIGLDCERSVIVHHRELTSYVPLGVVSLRTYRHWSEQLGRNTQIPTPISLCPGCLARLASSSWLASS